MDTIQTYLEEFAKRRGIKNKYFNVSNRRYRPVMLRINKNVCIGIFAAIK